VPISLSLAFTHGKTAAFVALLTTYFSTQQVRISPLSPTTRKQLSLLWEWENEIAHGIIFIDNRTIASNNLERSSDPYVALGYSTSPGMGKPAPLPKGRAVTHLIPSEGACMNKASLINLVLHPSTVTWYKLLPLCQLQRFFLFIITTPPGKFIESHAIEKHAAKRHS